MSIVLESELVTTIDQETLDSHLQNDSKFVSNAVYAGQWSALHESDELFLDSFETKISPINRKVVVESDTLPRLEYTLASNPAEKVQFSLQARFPMPILKINSPSNFESNTTVGNLDKTPGSVKSSITSEILRNSPTDTFYPCSSAQTSTNKLRLEVATVNLFGCHNLQINFDSGQSMEIPLRYFPKKIWALDVGILLEVEVTEFFGIIKEEYYTIVHPLNGMQLFNFDVNKPYPLNLSIIRNNNSFKNDKTAQTIYCEKRRNTDILPTNSFLEEESDNNDWVPENNYSPSRRSTYNQTPIKFKIVEITDACDLNASFSNRIIVTHDNSTSKYVLFTYRYVWEKTPDTNCKSGHQCWKVLNGDALSNRQYLNSLKYESEITDFSSSNEFSQASCFSIPLSCLADCFPSYPVSTKPTIFITSDVNFRPIIWFLTTSISQVIEVNKLTGKKGNKRMSTESLIKSFSLNELTGYTPHFHESTRSNNNRDFVCNHEWKLLINAPISDAVKLKCTSRDRFDLLLLMPGNRLFLWTGFNELVSCLVSGACSKTFSTSEELCTADIFSINSALHAKPSQVSSKIPRSTTSDVFPRTRNSMFKLPRLTTRDSKSFDVKLKANRNFRVRAYVYDSKKPHSNSINVLDISLDMRIKDFVVESFFEIAKLSKTECASLTVRELHRRFMLINFGSNDSSDTEWDNFLSAFISILKSSGFTVALKEPSVKKDDDKELDSSNISSPPSMLSPLSIEDCFLDDSDPNRISHCFIGSKCHVSYQRINCIIKKAYSIFKKVERSKTRNFVSQKYSHIGLNYSCIELVNALSELYPHLQCLYQSLQIRIFHKNNSLLFSEFMTLVAYTLGRLDLVAYYSVSSSTIFPFYVYRTSTETNNSTHNGSDGGDELLSNESKLLTPSVNGKHMDMFTYVSTSQNEKNFDNHSFTILPTNADDICTVYSHLTMSHPTIRHPVLDLKTICLLADKSKLTEKSTETIESIFHLLKNDIFNKKLSTLNPGLIQFVICLQERLKNMELKLNDLSNCSVIGREDLALNEMILKKKVNVSEIKPTINIEKSRDQYAYEEETLTSFYTSDNIDDGIYHLIKSQLVQAIFCNDKRVHEVRKMLQSSYPAHLTEVDIAHIKYKMDNENDWTTEQSQLSTLLSLSQRTLTLPIGRAAFTLGTVMPLSVKKIPMPALVVSAKLPPNNSIVVLESNRTDKGFFYWPRFHSGVAAGLSISPDWKTLDSSWIVYNREPNQEVESECLESQHAGFLFGLGLTGKLKMMDIVDLVEYMNNNEGFIALGLIVGLAASYMATKDKRLTRLCHLHIEPDIPKQFDSSCENLIKPSAVISLGLLYMEHPERPHIISVMSLLKSSIETSDSEITEGQRNALTLTCGFALGYMVLGKMNSKDVQCISNLNIPDLLLEYTTNQSFGSIASMSSLMALGLMYLKTNNELIAERIGSLCDKDSIYFNSHKDVMLYATLCKNLIMWNRITPTREWVESNIPKLYQASYHTMLKNISQQNTTAQYDDAVLYITAGACMAVAIKYAGSFNPKAKEVLLEYAKISTKLFYTKVIKLTDKLKKFAAKASLNVILNAASIVSAGTGDLELMRIIRKLHYRRIQQIGYGDQMALHASLGFLFLGGGTCTFKTNNTSVAGLLTSLFAIYPDSTTDNFIHMQLLRHFWALSAENRCLVTREAGTWDICNLNVEITFKDSTRKPLVLMSPCILPETDLIEELNITGQYVWPLKIQSKDIPIYEWNTRLNCKIILVKNILEGWDLDRRITYGQNKRRFVDMKTIKNFLTNKESTKAKVFIVSRKNDTFLQTNKNVDNYSLMGCRKRYKDVEKTAISNVIDDLNKNVYKLSQSTGSVLEYCFSENKLLLVPLFSWLCYKLENLEARLDVNFVKTMQIISSLLQLYNSGDQEKSAICPLGAQKFLMYAEASLKAFMRKLDASSPLLLDTQNITSKTLCSFHTHQAAYIMYKNWPMNLSPNYIAELYVRGGEFNVLMNIEQWFKFDDIPFNALRKMYKINQSSHAHK